MSASVLALGLLGWLAWPQANYDSLNGEQFQEGLQAHPDAYLLDVRTPREYASGHLKDARNVDITQSGFKEAIAKLDTSRPVYLYCRSGARSAKAASIVHSQGFAQVAHLSGGLRNWPGQVVR
mgnify:FL=1